MHFDRFDPAREVISDPCYFDSWTSRAELLSTLKAGRTFDVVVLGATFEGVALAHIAALCGMRTLLVELDDFQTNRYRFTVDSFYPPIETGGVGKIFRNFGRKRKVDRFIESHQHLTTFASNSLKSSQGFFSSGAFLIDSLVAAQREGACVVNYIRLVSYSYDKNQALELQLVDTLSDNKFNLRAGVVYNTQATQYGNYGRVTVAPWTTSLALQPVEDLFIPDYFVDRCSLFNLGSSRLATLVRPYCAGAQVSFYHPVCSIKNQADHQLGDHLDELVRVLEIPESSLSGRFSYTNYQPVYKQAIFESLFQPRYWKVSGGLIYLINSNLPDIYQIALSGLNLAFKIAGRPRQEELLEPPCLPASFAYENSIAEFKKAAHLVGVPVWYIERAIERFGSRVRYLLGKQEYLEIVEGICLKGELLLAVVAEQAVTLRDLLHGRLGFSVAVAEELTTSAKLKAALSELDLLDRMLPLKEDLNDPGVSIKQS